MYPWYDPWEENPCTGMHTGTGWSHSRINPWSRTALPRVVLVVTAPSVSIARGATSHPKENQGFESIQTLEIEGSSPKEGLFGSL